MKYIWESFLSSPSQNENQTAKMAQFLHGLRRAMVEDFSLRFFEARPKNLGKVFADKIKYATKDVQEKVEYNRDLDRAASLETNGKSVLKNNWVELKSAIFVKLSFFLGLINIFELESAEERQVFKELLDLFWKIPPRLFFILFLQFYSIVTIQTI